MDMILPKKQMTEEDIKLQYITPAITSKWEQGKITMETQITDGKMNIRGNITYPEILRQYFINHPQSIDKYTFLQNSAFTHWVKEKCSKI